MVGILESKVIDSTHQGELISVALAFMFENVGNDGAGIVHDETPLSWFGLSLPLWVGGKMMHIISAYGLRFTPPVVGGCRVSHGMSACQAEN